MRIHQSININDMVRKIDKIQVILEDQCILKASFFDNNYPEANIPGDPKGFQWNTYVHENCNIYGFEIWKDNRDHNFYVRSSEDCREEASRENLHPAVL